jgi:hypothetical protein
VSAVGFPPLASRSVVTVGARCMASSLALDAEKRLICLASLWGKLGA